MSSTNYIGELGFKSSRGGHGQGDLLYNKLPRKWNPAGYRDCSFIAGLIEMSQAGHVALVLIVACLAGTATEATAAEPHGRTYPFRGMIDLIDWGMDQLAGRINRTHGADADADQWRMRLRGVGADRIT